MNLKIAENLRLPKDAVTKTFAVLAIRGAGKSYALAVMAEEMLKAHMQVVIIDPTSAHWGLRASADGKGPGLPIIVMGGNHGDVPLEEGAGEIVADFIVDERVSVILDLSLMRKNAQVRFMTTFSEHLYHRKGQKGNQDPLHMMIDEADRIAPQKPYPDQMRLLGAIEDIVRLGRIRGFGISMATQRAAVLNKNVLTQIETLIVLRTTSPQDRKAINEWVEANASEAELKKVAESLSSLPTGTAWFWSPSWLNILQQVKIRERETFNSSATPKIGEKRAEPKKMAAVDLERLKGRIAATIEKAKAEDPRALRLEVSMLKTLLAEAQAQAKRNKPLIYEKPVEVPMLKDYQLKRVEAMITNLDAITDRAKGIRESVIGELKGLVSYFKDKQAIKSIFAANIGKTPYSYPIKTPPLNPKIAAEWKESSKENGSIGKGERTILKVIAQHRNQGGATREQITVITGYKRSSRDTYLQRLLSGQYVALFGGSIIPTEKGLQVLGGDQDALPTGPALREHWFGRLGGGEQVIFRKVVESYPEPIGREKISETTNYARSSRDTYLQRLISRKLVVPVGNGEVKASEILFQ